MKKITYLIFCMFLTNMTWSQDLYVGSGAAITTIPGGVLFAGSNVSVDGAASLATMSDATASGSLIVNGNTTGDVVYKRYVNDTDWHLVSAPLTSQSVPSFVGDGVNGVPQSVSTSNYGVSYYKNTNTAGNRWTYHNTSPSAENQEILTSFTAGHGYSMERSAAGTYTFTGTMANADVSVTIPTTTTTCTHLWSAIGNPFPSFLPLNDAANVANILADNVAKLDASFAFIYVWNGTSKEYDPIGLGGAALQLAPGQAFMVRAKSTSETFVFSKASQNHNSGVATFYISSTATPTISVHLTNGTLNKSADLEFLDSSTTGLDTGYDAGAYQDGTPAFSINTHLVSDSQGIDFTRQSLPTSSVDSEVSIPLSMYAGIDEEVTFSVATNNLPDGVSVYLEDTLNNTFTNLKEAPLALKTTSALSDT